ncbi:hypothetical protein HispidOSU_008288, partial [Sigmodon hispidus]
PQNNNQILMSSTTRNISTEISANLAHTSYDDLPSSEETLLMRGDVGHANSVEQQLIGVNPGSPLRFD